MAKKKPKPNITYSDMWRVDGCGDRVTRWSLQVHISSLPSQKAAEAIRDAIAAMVQALQ